jgi:long-chain acyl-CoA synthetase
MADERLRWADATASDPTMPPHPTIVHALWAAERDHPQGVALVCDGRRVSYAELAREVRTLRDGLLSNGALEERVAILKSSSIEAVIAILAVMAARAQAVPINPFFTLPELRAVLREAEPNVVLVGREARDKMAPLVAEFGFVCVDIDAAARPRGREGRVANDAESNPGPHDLALLISTGGTTGEPKGVVHTHRSLSASLVQHVNAWPLELRSERFLSAAPIFHIWGLAYAAFVPVYVQGAHFIVSRFDPERVLDAIERNDITVFSGGPAPIYMGLVQSPRFAATDFSSLKYCLTGGAACPEGLHRLWRSHTGCRLLEGWGLSEAAPVCLNPPDAPRARSVGRPVIGTEIQCVDVETGQRILQPGEVGELIVRGPQVMLGYRGKPTATHEVLRGGWLHTGDVGYQDADSYVFLVDRKKDMIIVGGYNVYPRAVDEVLFKHPEIAEAATVGKPDDRLGEVLVAFVVRKPGSSLNQEEFFDYCRANLVKYRRPVEVTFLESLPRTNAKKLDKRALGARALELKP